MNQKLFPVNVNVSMIHISTSLIGQNLTFVSAWQTQKRKADGPWVWTVRLCLAPCFVGIESFLTKAPRTVFAHRKPTFCCFQHSFTLIVWRHQFHLLLVEF